MIEVTALDRAKLAYYDSTRAMMAGEDVTITESEVQALLAPLSEADMVQFDRYQQDCLADTYDWLMKDFSPELKKAIDLYITDNASFIKDGVRVPQDERTATIDTIPANDLVNAMQLLAHPVVNAMVRKKLLDGGMTDEDIEKRTAELDKEKAAKAA